MKADLQRILKAVLPLERYEHVGLHEPSFSQAEEANVLECLRTGWVSYQGKFVGEFEQLLAEICGTKHAIVVTSGTVALYLALKVIGVEPGDEVLIPSLTFVATASSIHHLGAIAHFVEVDQSNLGIDVAKLEQHLETIAIIKDGVLYNKQTKNPIKAIVPVHIFGHPVDLSPLMIVAKKYKLKVVEDAAEALGSKYKGEPIGGFGDAAILSFNGNKIITTGGGGAILTNDDAMASDLKHLSTTAKVPHKYEFVHDQIGFNFRLPNVNAAIGVAQLHKLDEFLRNKRNLAKKYEALFANNEYFEFIKEPSYASSNFWLNAIKIKSDYQDEKNTLIEVLINDKIFVRPLWRPLHTLEIYKSNPRVLDLSITEDLYNRVICLPSSAFLYETK